MYWEIGIKFMIKSVYSYVRHLFKHSRHQGLPWIRESSFEVK